MANTRRKKHDGTGVRADRRDSGHSDRGGGLILGDQSLGGLLNIDILEDIIHLVTGGLLAYIGFGQRDEGLARNVVGGLGVAYLLVGMLGFVIPMLFGLLPHGYSIVDNIIHLALGAAGIAVALASQGGTTARAE